MFGVVFATIGATFSVIILTLVIFTVVNSMYFEFYEEDEEDEQ